jgi:archaellum biogenesis protein FlaJ (TadC family)
MFNSHGPKTLWLLLTPSQGYTMIIIIIIIILLLSSSCLLMGNDGGRVRYSDYHFPALLIILQDHHYIQAAIDNAVSHEEQALITPA